MYGLYHASRSQRRAALPANSHWSATDMSGAMARSGDVAWLDIASDGRVIGGGVTMLADPTGPTLVELTRHPVLAELAALAARADELIGRIVPSASGELFYWFAPSPRGADGTLRALAVDVATFGALIERFHHDHRVTAAEKRTLFQLVAGGGPRESAAADGVSFETKRAQLKSLCAKLGCTGQTDLVRRSVGQLIHLLHATSPAG